MNISSSRADTAKKKMLPPILGRMSVLAKLMRSFTLKFLTRPVMVSAGVFLARKGRLCRRRGRQVADKSDQLWVDEVDMVSQVDWFMHGMEGQDYAHPQVMVTGYLLLNQQSAGS
jgi:hypothetical protein